MDAETHCLTLGAAETFATNGRLFIYVLRNVPLR